MHLPLEYCPLDLGHADQMVSVTIEANLGVYPFLKHGLITQQGFRQDTIRLIQLSFEQQENSRQILNNPHLRCAAGMRLNGKLVAVGMSIDLFQQLQAFSRLMYEDETHPYQKTNLLLKSLDLKDLKPGHAVFNYRWSVLPGLNNQGIAVRFAYEGAKAYLSRGYKYSYGFMMVENAIQIIIKMGGKIVASTDYVGEGFKFTVNLVRLELKKFVESYERFTRKMPTAKL